MQTLQSKHHTSLCLPAVVLSSTPPPACIANIVQQSPPQVPPVTTTVPTLTAVTGSQPSFGVPNRSASLLKTAIAKVSAGPYSTKGNILLDEGAQRSFISQELADKLYLKATYTEQISLSSFSNPASAARSL